MFSLRHPHALAVGFLLAFGSAGLAADFPAPEPGDYAIRDFRFHSGETLPELRMHYLTFGKPKTGSSLSREYTLRIVGQ